MGILTHNQIFAVIGSAKFLVYNVISINPHSPEKIPLPIAADVTEIPFRRAILREIMSYR